MSNGNDEADAPTVGLIVGSVRIDVEVPPHVFRLATAEASSRRFSIDSSVSMVITDLLRALLPAHIRPATERQVSYALDIGAELGIQVPEGVLADSTACSMFIDEHKAEYDAARQEQARWKELRNDLARTANRLHRGRVAFALLQDGVPPDDVGKRLGVKAPTIEKYVLSHSEWAEQDMNTPRNRCLKEVLIMMEDGQEAYVAASTLIGTLVKESKVNPLSCILERAGALS